MQAQSGSWKFSDDELKTLAEVEREYVMRVLEACGGSQSKAALVLGIARNTLWRKLNSYA